MIKYIFNGIVFQTNMWNLTSVWRKISMTAKHPISTENDIKTNKKSQKQYANTVPMAQTYHGQGAVKYTVKVRNCAHLWNSITHKINLKIVVLSQMFPLKSRKVMASEVLMEAKTN